MRCEFIRQVGLQRLGYPKVVRLGLHTHHTHDNHKHHAQGDP